MALDDNNAEQLEILIGENAAGKVFEIFSGENIYIPKRILIKKRHEIIMKEFREGATYRELGIKYGYTENYIRKIVNKKRKKR
jgi:Mor family transcriptional regulator